MATSTTAINSTSVYNALHRTTLKRIGNLGKPNGTYLLTGTKAVVAADYDVAGDLINLFDVPPSTYLLGASIVADKDYDTGGTAGTFDLIASDVIGTASTVTGATAQIMGNQPATDGVEIVSDSASDVAVDVTVIGIAGSDVVQVSTKTLTGTSPVTMHFTTTWVKVLAVKVSSGTQVGTITVREASADQTITTLAPGVTSRGVSTVASTSTAFGGRLIDIVAGGATTKQIGFKGTNIAGETIYDSQALNGTTKVQSNSIFQTVTEIYYGDVENAVVVTVTPTEQLLISAATVFNAADPTPMNFNGAAISGSAFGMDIGDKTLALRVVTAPTTANTGTVTFTYKFLVFQGLTTSLS